MVKSLKLSTRLCEDAERDSCQVGTESQEDASVDGVAACGLLRPRATKTAGSGSCWRSSELPPKLRLPSRLLPAIVNDIVDIEQLAGNQLQKLHTLDTRPARAGLARPDNRILAEPSDVRQCPPPIIQLPKSTKQACGVFFL